MYLTELSDSFLLVALFSADQAGQSSTVAPEEENFGVAPVEG